jgi:alkylated DNA repair dioxygenase AlkB
MQQVETIVAPDAELRYWAQLFTPDDAAALFADLRAEVAWASKSILICGREVLQPRLTAWYGDPGTAYTYSGKRNEPRPWIEPLARVRQRVQEETGLPFDSVLCNLYRDGADSMGWHRDAEPELGHEPAIASVSLGATRRFVMKHRRRSVDRLVLELADASLLLMTGPTQHHWRHSVPKTARSVGERINLTFRRIVSRP